MNKTLLNIIAATALFATACGSDSDYSDQALLSEIVTVESTGDDGTRFSFRRYGDSPLIIIEDKSLSIKEEYVGSRMLLRYYLASGEAYAPGDIRAIGLAAINNDTTVVRPVERYGWDADAVYLNAIWRSGEYINIHLRAVYSDTPRYFCLMVDSLTMDDAVPQVYLVHNTLGAPDNYMSEFYSSVDISNVWNQPGCRGIEVHVNDSNLKKDIYTFNK